MFNKISEQLDLARGEIAELQPHVNKLADERNRLEREGDRTAAANVNQDWYRLNGQLADAEQDRDKMQGMPARLSACIVAHILIAAGCCAAGYWAFRDPPLIEAVAVG